MAFIPPVYVVPEAQAATPPQDPEEGGAAEGVGDGAAGEDGGDDEPLHPPMHVCMFANCEPGYNRWFWVVSKEPMTPVATLTRLSAPFLSEESS